MSRVTVPTATKGQAPSHAPPDMMYTPGGKLARCLGWSSIGLGLAEMLYPRQITVLTGVCDLQQLQRCGLREVVTGVGILASRQPAPWMWARVAGDVYDLAILGRVAESATDEVNRRKTSLSILALAGVAAVDLTSATTLTTAQRLES